MTYFCSASTVAHRAICRSSWAGIIWSITENKHQDSISYKIACHRNPAGWLSQILTVAHKWQTLITLSDTFVLILFTIWMIHDSLCKLMPEETDKVEVDNWNYGFGCINVCQTASPCDVKPNSPHLALVYWLVLWVYHPAHWVVVSWPS